MEFDNKIVKFNIFEAMKHPRDDQSVFSLDTLETLDLDTLNFQKKEKNDNLEIVLSQALQESDIGIQMDDEVKEIIMGLQSMPMIPGRHDLCRVELPSYLTKLLPSTE